MSKPVYATQDADGSRIARDATIFKFNTVGEAHEYLLGGYRSGRMKSVDSRDRARRLRRLLDEVDESAARRQSRRGRRVRSIQLHPIIGSSARHPPWRAILVDHAICRRACCRRNQRAGGLIINHIFITTIEHKHGMDQYAAESRELAFGAVADYVRGNWSDLTHRDDFPQSCDNLDDDQAVAIYFKESALIGDEFYSIEEVPIIRSAIIIDTERELAELAGHGTD